jgi:hypothetical protein
MFWKNHENACQILAPFLSEAVEASLHYFFENWLIKLKFPNLPNPLGIIIQKNDGSFYPSERIYFIYFDMRHPVDTIMNVSKKGHFSDPTTHPVLLLT